MCGVIGIISSARNIIDDGIVLSNGENNRGEQKCGGAVFDGKTVRFYRGDGKVAEVFGARDKRKWSKLVGPVGIFHVLYSTVCEKGKTSQTMVQQPFPFRFLSCVGAISYNGNLVRIDGLRNQAKRLGYKFKSGVSDTEVIAALLSVSKKRDFLGALIEVLKKIEGKGAFSMVIMYDGKLYGVRDQNGIRPLCIIKKNGKNGDSDSYILASESSVFPALDATRFVRNVDMGEIVVLSPNGIKRSIKWTNNTKSAFCSCEFIYFANAASRFFGVSAYAFRVKAGEILARKYPVKADVVVPVPDSGRGYSDGFSSVSGISSREGLMKTRYAVRTFMQPREVNRGEKQRAKLQALPDVMDERDVILTEDSIFRASVAPMVVKMCREHGGARAVHVRVGSPPVCHRCHLGLDTSTNEELVASHMTPEEIRRKVVLSDTLEYLTVEELRQVFTELGISPDDLCLGCFTGEYPVAPPK